jgi:hypothetical protein
VKARNAIVLLLALIPLSGELRGSGLPVISSHPRLMLTSADRARLLARVSADEPAWTALRAQADVLSGYSIDPYIYDRRAQEPDNTIFYDYQGSGWFEAAVPLALAYQMTGDSRYSDKLAALADEMIGAQSRPENNPPAGLPPLEPDNYYPTRYLGPTAALIYDWCYDALGAARRAQLVALMNAYFDDIRANAYQANTSADGNYFGGHLTAAGFMGYATAGDNPRAAEMIDWARIRFDGTGSTLVPADEVPDAHFDQLFDGGIHPLLATGYNGPADLAGAPFKGGFDFQGWSYGSGDYDRIIDYLLAVKSATGEDLIGAHRDWFSQILRAEKEALLPDRFGIDPCGDWGGNYGATVPLSLPARLAHLLAGTPDGPAAQGFFSTDIDRSGRYEDGFAFGLSEWEDFFFSDSSRPASPMTLPPYYTGFGPVYPAGGTTNGAIPYFLMRSDWGPGAAWASAAMGTQWYDDHQHSNAGHIEIARGSDFLLVDASQWMGDAGSSGLVGGCTEEDNAAPANTLFFDDYGDFMHGGPQYVGGQGYWGLDQVGADELTPAYSYVRSDLTTAYNRSADPADQAGRKLDHFVRSILYLRPAGVFLVMDDAEALPSSNPRGPYRMHLRWHLPNVPSISGDTARVDQGSSRLYLRTLLPAGASIVAVDESNNPDNSDPSLDYYFNSGTWRLEVSEPGALATRFLTLLAPGDASFGGVDAVAVSANGGGMIGARITSAGRTDVALFPAGPGAAPAPISSVSYASAAGANHTLAGMAPGAAYSVEFDGSTVTVRLDAVGAVLASAAGVLQFRTEDQGEPSVVPVEPSLPAPIGGRGIGAGSPPEPQALGQVPSGAWGGNRVAVNVTPQVADFEFDCAHGRIPAPMLLDPQNRFAIDGVYVQEHGGPIGPGPEDSHPARYAGSTDGVTMTFTVTLTDSGAIIGSYVVALGGPPRIVKCL